MKGQNASHFSDMINVCNILCLPSIIKKISTFAAFKKGRNSAKARFWSETLSSH